ncbi:hypothetical protein [Haloechinothrix sp. LS1_15]|uniref:hypothetical protein n=1 Tax=Haloechinothrix sp. LS1_15 TaxID=2652248 RepID=UPI00294AB6E5|nr:hypothetical protein [Haloechinothrix sp. LS1_15]
MTRTQASNLDVRSTAGHRDKRDQHEREHQSQVMVPRPRDDDEGFEPTIVRGRE